MRFTTPLDSFTAVAPGSKANVQVTNNRNYQSIMLVTGAASAAELDYMIRTVSLWLGSLPLINLTIPQLYALLAYRGIPVGNGEIPLLFARPEIRTPTGEELTSFNTFGLSNLVLKVDYRTNGEYNALKSAATSTTVTTGFTPTLYGIAEYNFDNTGNRSFIQTTDILIPNSGAGEGDFGTLTREGAYKAIHIFSGLASKVRVFRDQLELLERDLAIIDAINRRYGLTRQSNHFPVDFGYTNQAMDLLEMKVKDAAGNYVQVGTFNLKITTTGAGSMPAIVERVINI